MLITRQVSQLGWLLVGCLMLRIKHNGALDKAGMGLTTLTSKVLRSPVPALSALPAAWLSACLARVVAADQVCENCDDTLYTLCITLRWQL